MYDNDHNSCEKSSLQFIFFSDRRSVTADGRESRRHLWLAVYADDRGVAIGCAGCAMHDDQRPDGCIVNLQEPFVPNFIKIKNVLRPQ